MKQWKSEQLGSLLNSLIPNRDKGIEISETKPQSLAKSVTKENKLELHLMKHCRIIATVNQTVDMGRVATNT